MHPLCLVGLATWLQCMLTVKCWLICSSVGLLKLGCAAQHVPPSGIVQYLHCVVALSVCLFGYVMQPIFRCCCVGVCVSCQVQRVSSWRWHLALLCCCTCHAGYAVWGVVLLTPLRYCAAELLCSCSCMAAVCGLSATATVPVVDDRLTGSSAVLLSMRCRTSHSLHTWCIRPCVPQVLQTAFRGCSNGLCRRCASRACWPCYQAVEARREFILQISGLRAAGLSSKKCDCNRACCHALPCSRFLLETECPFCGR